VKPLVVVIGGLWSAARRHRRRECAVRKLSARR